MCGGEGPSHYKAWNIGLYHWWLGCHPEGPQQDGEMAKQESHEIQQREMPRRPESGEKQSHAPRLGTV